MIYTGTIYSKKVYVKIILFLELFIYITFNYFDIATRGNWIYSYYLKYLAILLCLVLVLFIGTNGHDRLDTMLLNMALFFTVIADLCLLLLSYHVLGVFFFCLVQITYILRHSRGSNKNRKVFKDMIYILGVVFILNVIIKFLRIDSMNGQLLRIGSLYAVLLLYSLYAAWNTFNRKFYPIHSCIYISLGMTLFLFCDVNVAVSNISSNIMMFNINITNLSRYLIWIFYLPAQVLLSLSGFEDF